jgi:hypothetical protein
VLVQQDMEGKPINQWTTEAQESVLRMKGSTDS